MKKIRFLIVVFASILNSCNKKTENINVAIKTEESLNVKIDTEKISERNLPKEIEFEGNLKKLRILNDLDGEHIILLTETGKIPSKKILNQEDEYDYKIFAYDYLLKKTENKYILNWKTQDFETNCEFDLIMGFLKNTFKITDLDKNGKSEIWIMYQKACVSDVSPIEMKIIMHEGKQKFALRGNSVVNPGDGRIGGEYKIDENFKNAPKEFEEFALKMWKENNLQTYE